MILDKLKSWEYYYDKLPLYFKNSYGIVEHFKIWYDLIVLFDETEDDIINAFDIFNNDYFTLNNIVATEYESDLLDKIAYVFGVCRDFDVCYTDPTNSSLTITKQLHLNNKLLLLLIKAIIIKNNYKGTYEETIEFYESINLPIYILNSANSAEAFVYFDKSSLDLSYTDDEIENIYAMFYSGLFTLQSLGISYTMFVVEGMFEQIMWDISIWDVARWS